MAKKNDMNGWALALLRVVLGIVFLYHGYLKLFVAGGFKMTAEFMAGIFGVSLAAGAWLGLLVSVAEFAGGVFLVLGVVTRWSSALLVVEMLVALFAVHLKNGFLVSKGGYEFVLVLIAGLVVVWASGAGKLAWGSRLKSKNLQ